MVKHIHNRIVQFLSSHSPVMTLFCCVVSLLFLGWLDILTGDYSLIVFYLIPVSLAAWFVGKWSGVLFCLFAIVVRIFADELSRPSTYAYSVLNYWNELVEFIFLTIMSLLFSTLKENLESEQKLARRDPLTDTLNRRAFFDLARQEIKRAQRYDFPLSVAYIDLDNFKTVNDQLGHESGDELLMKVVSIIRLQTRSMDVLARFGGDEFVILMPDTEGRSAQMLLEQMHDNLDQTMIQGGWPVTFSIGVVTYLKVPSTVDELIRNADELMYTAKRSGKSRLFHKEIGDVTHG
jgi:diguanylate cyclase (GGDEF)-like protein